MRDVGFGAEEVNAVEPLLTTRNDKGEIEGVKYAQITTVLVNAIKEQQTELDRLRKLVDSQQQTIEVFKKFLCAEKRDTALCQ